MTAFPAEVWSFSSPTLPHGSLKHKHHLCVADDGLFLFLGTHYDHEYRRGASWKDIRRSTLVIPNSEVPFLKETRSGKSAISLHPVMRRIPDATIAKGNPRGSVSKSLMGRVLAFIKDNPCVPPRDRDLVIEGLYGFYGLDFARFDAISQGREIRRDRGGIAS